MKRLVLASGVALAASGAAADPVKCIDANGKVRYVDSSVPGTEKCTPVTTETQTVSPQRPAGAYPGTTPSRPPSQRGAELTAAQKQLEDAKRALAEQEAIRNGDEKNYQRVLDRLKPYQEAVERAQQNVDKAQREAR
jgi:hypothetical protein